MPKLANQVMDIVSYIPDALRDVLSKKDGL